MFFNPWDWHLKNNITYYWLTYPMHFISQWRLPILFVISGIGVFYTMKRIDVFQFVKQRTSRLLLPLIIGIVIIIPPQIYFERLSQGLHYSSYLDFIMNSAFRGIYPNGNFSWHHLWFLPYLLFFSVIFAPLFFWLQNKRTHLKSIIVIIGILLLLSDYLLRARFPSTHAFWGDWYNISTYGILFLSGFIVALNFDTIFEFCKNNRHKLLTLSIIIYAFHFISSELQIINSFIKVCNMIFWILTIFGFSTIYLNRDNRFLKYANNAVYPFYILHQTITVAIGYYIMNLNISSLFKLIILTIGTLGLCVLLYEILRRSKLVSPLLGIK